MTIQITIKSWHIAAIFVVATVLMAQQYTSVYSQHLFNSLIDATDIGLTTPKQGKFTTSSASGGYTGNLHGNADTATNAQTAVNAQHVPWTGVSGPPVVTQWNWSWAGQAGQPGWLWGSNDGYNMEVWNPSNFSVNYANSTNYANSSGVANSVAWANISGKPYPVSAGQTWNWAPQGGQGWMWGTPDGNNMYPYNPANFSVNYANSANVANYAATAPWSGISGPPPVTTWSWQYAGQSGQPTWVWGTNDGNIMQVWNPRTWIVSGADWATGAGHASTADNATNASNVPWSGVSGKPLDYYFSVNGCQIPNGGQNTVGCEGVVGIPAQPDTNYEIVCMARSNTDASVNVSMLGASPKGTNTVSLFWQQIQSNTQNHPYTPSADCYLHHN
jgi:hypothetical protein